MAEAVVRFAVERLGDLLISEAKFLYAVEDKVREIQGLLTKLQKFLEDADIKRGNDPEVGRWVAKIRQLALQTEDVLETYAVKVASRREEGGHIKEIMRRYACIVGECMWRLACIIGESITLHEIGSEIGNIQDEIRKLDTSRQTIGIQALPGHQAESSKAAEERQKGRISNGLLINENDFVGMGDEIEELVLHLKKEDRGYEVVSVLGMGGQGKTTLAQRLYNHPDVRSHFQAFAWVCVTQKFEEQKVLQDILRGLLETKNDDIRRTGDKKKKKKKEKKLIRLLETTNDDIRRELVSLLRRTQEKWTQEKFKCLIVIDDIWDVAHWNILKNVIWISSTKILLTTRKKAVADVGFRYDLRSLKIEEGCELFLKKAFPRDDEIIVDKSEKVELGRDMVQQCQGLPLAISILGGILKNKNSLEEWKMVKKDVVTHIRRGEGFEGDDVVKGILGLSYDDLSFRLKQLFLYLGTFKKDEEINSGELYLLWIAEGMIPLAKKAKGEMLIDVAEGYLVELAERSLIQLEPMDKRVWKDSPVPWLKVRSCRLHDLIRDLCFLKGKEENFLKMIGFQEARNECMEARRLAVYRYDDVDNLLDNIAWEQFRSLLFFNASNLQEKVPNLRDFKLVRVLKLDRFKFTKEELSRGIIELIHLRYLSLKDCELEELPSCIRDLRYLETLDLRVGSSVVIPDVLWKMKLLKHLYLPDYVRLVVNKKLRFDGLKELELVWHFDASKCDVNDLTKLTNLQILDTRTDTLQDQEAVMNFVNSNLHHRRYTSLEVRRDNDLIQLLQCENIDKLSIYRNIRGNYVIPQPRPSQSLTCIRLCYCNIEADTIELLEKLPNLQNLELLHSSFANEFVCTPNSFPQLTHLQLWGLKKLERWRVDEGALPNLSKLDVCDCKELEMLPEGLKFVESLRELEIWWMPKAFNDGVRDMYGVEGPDFHKVRRIPNIFIV